MTKTKIGTRGGLILLLLLPSLAATANTPAVSATNYQIQGDSGDTYSSGDRVTYFYMLGAAATFPLGQYLGASLAGHYGNNTLLPTPATNALNAAYPWGGCSYHSSGLDASLFTRTASIGRVGIGYGGNKLDARCDASFVATDSNTLSTKTYRTDAEYYFSSVTIGAAWARTKFESGADQTYDALTASWYPTQVSRISFTADGLDFKNTYNLAVEYQPEFLDNALGVALSITTQHETISTQTISLGLRYYFGTNVDLLTRDRNYR